MEIEEYAKTFKEIGHPARLRILKELIKYGEQGVPVGQLQKSVGIPASTLTHHIGALMSVSLMQQRREGRILWCSVLYPQLYQAIHFLTHECCSQSEEKAKPAPGS
ncbi:MAG: ArsR/SmtB family transcription factor [Spirochaetia bacterium]